MITASQAAKETGWSRRTIRKWCQQGKIAGAIKKGNRWYIPEEALAAIARSAIEARHEPTPGPELKLEDLTEEDLQELPEATLAEIAGVTLQQIAEQVEKIAAAAQMIYMLGDKTSVDPADQDPHIDMIAALAQIPLKEQAAIVYRYYANLTPPEIAQLLDVSRTTVHRLINRAAQKLKPLLETPEPQKKPPRAPFQPPPISGDLEPQDRAPTAPETQQTPRSDVTAGEAHQSRPGERPIRDPGAKRE